MDNSEARKRHLETVPDVAGSDIYRSLTRDEWRAQHEGLVAKLEESNRRIGITPGGFTPKLFVFQVRDMYTADAGWYGPEEQEAEIEPRILTIVGWIVRDDGVHTHIASIHDTKTDKYGDGVVVLNKQIMDVQELRMA